MVSLQTTLLSISWGLIPALLASILESWASAPMIRSSIQAWFESICMSSDKRIEQSAPNKSVCYSVSFTLKLSLQTRVLPCSRSKYDLKVKRLKATVDESAGEFLCPITHALPVDPVTAEDGHVYERSAIEDWLSKGRHTSPITNEAMGTRLTSAVQVTPPSFF